MPEVFVFADGSSREFPPLSPALASDVEALVSVFGDHAVVVDDTFEEVTPRCDICGLSEEEVAGVFADGNWNGETGCHLSCEARQRVQRAAERVRAGVALTPARARRNAPRPMPLICSECRQSEDWYGPSGWDSDAGTHFVCQGDEWWDDEAEASGTVCTSESCACNAPVYVPKPEDKVDPRAFVAEGVQGAA